MQPRGSSPSQLQDLTHGQAWRKESMASRDPPPVTVEGTGLIESGLMRVTPCQLMQEEEVKGRVRRKEARRSPMRSAPDIPAGVRGVLACSVPVTDLGAAH